MAKYPGQLPDVFIQLHLSISLLLDADPSSKRGQLVFGRCHLVGCFWKNRIRLNLSCSSVIAVCTERLIGTLRPLYVRETWPRWKMPAVLAVLIGVPFLLTMYEVCEIITSALAFSMLNTSAELCISAIQPKFTKNA